MYKYKTEHLKFIQSKLGMNAERNGLAARGACLLRAQGL